MSKPKRKPKDKLDLKIPKDRWQFCREVQVPSFYMTPGKKDPHSGNPSEPRKVKVAPSITKSVLLDLAQYDWPGNDNFKGNGNIAHGTGLKVRSVSKGISVLKSIGALERTFQGVKKTAISRLNWGVLDKLRKPFDPDDELQPIKTEDAEDDDDDLDGERKPPKADDPEDDVSDLGPRVEKNEKTEPEKAGDPAKHLVDLFMEFGPYHKLRPTIEIVVKGLLRSKSADEIKAAWERLEDRQKAHVVSTATNPGGYLRSMLVNAIDQPQQKPDEDDHGWSSNEQMMKDQVAEAKAGKDGVGLNLAELSDDRAVASFVKWASDWLDREAGEDINYEVDLPNKEIRIFSMALTG